MEQKTVVQLENQAQAIVGSILEQVLREGAQRLLQKAIEEEVSA